MKSRVQILFTLLLLSLLSCKEDEISVTNEVDNYIAGLQSGKYNNAIELPAFTTEAIPALLEYSNHTERITQFPRNPISSHSNPDCTIGIYALWTIESIRLSYTQVESMPGRFPSLNPKLAKREADTLEYVESATHQQEAANAYRTWWMRAQLISVDSLMQIDPLEGSGFQWH